MGGLLDRLNMWWQNATNVQRYGTLGGIALVILMLAGTFMVASQPKYTLLYGGLTQADQAAVVSEIQALGVSVKYDQPGQVEVPSDKLPEVRMKLATAGKLPKSSHPGLGDLGSMNLYTTPAVERERLKSILEGELARSVETVPGVQTARVHITLGDPSPFGDQRRPATASINLVTSSSGNVSRDQARGMAMLVANGVDGLDMNNVVVLNEKMEPLFNGAEMEGTGNMAERKIDLERQISKTEERRLQNALDTMFGPGSTLVTVRAEVDLDEETSVTNEREYKKGIEVQTAKETMPVGGGAAPTEAGAARNLAPAAANPVSAPVGKYEQKVTKVEPGVKDVQKNTKKATGTIKSMVINVAANVGRFKPEEAEKRTAFESAVKEFVATEFANKQAGEDRDKFIAKVTPVEFDNSTQVKAEAAQKIAESSSQRQQIISMLPIVALLGVGFMVVKQIGKMTKPTRFMMATPDGSMVPVTVGSNGQIQAPAMYNQPDANGQMMQQGAQPMTANAQSLGQLGIPTNMPPENQLAYALEQQQTEAKQHESGIEFEDTDERLRIARIKERTSIPLEQIKQMSKERPDAVAMLLKSWLSEERR